MPSVMNITGALAAAMLAVVPGALAQVTSNQDSSPGSPWPTVRRDPGYGTSAAADTAYIRQTIRGNFFEVGLGRVADSRAQDSGVKQFAERMISEHNSMNQQWAALAKTNRMATNVFDVGPSEQQTIDRLEDLDGTAFDQAYMAEMIRHHEQDLAAFQRMGSSASSTGVRQLANSGAPRIQEHLTLARQIGSRIGISTTAGSTGGVIFPKTAPANQKPTSPSQKPTSPYEKPTSSSDDRAENDRNNRGTLRAEDRAFVQNVLQNHLMHIRLAERAQREAKSDEIRRLAERLEDDYEEWQERWEDLADRYRVEKPAHLGRLHGEKVERLERASKRNFDRTYAAIVAENLESVVPYFEKEGQAVRSPAVRRLVNDELPVIREYLARARRLEKQASGRVEESDREKASR
ncbi:MAG: DUF4142 domain-containing protein [Gemmatimonadales bacterium]|nr:DUF4142 domain-containing protein [Gemmatimonadales bacterium]